MIKKSITSLQFDIRKIAEYASQKKNCIRADIGEPNYAPPQQFTTILSELLPHEKFEYAPTFGVPELISSLTDFENHKVQNFSNHQFCITTGAQAAIFSVCSALLSENDEILVHKAYYPPYKSIAKICGATITEADFYNHDSLESALTDKTKLLILNSPNNPTGDIFSEKTLQHIAAFAQKHGLIILSDDVYDRLIFDDDVLKKTPALHISAYAPEHTIICNSVSKTLCLTGIRIGWMLGEKTLISEIAKVHRNINSCPASTFQRAIAQYLPESDTYLETYKNYFKKKSEKISQVFIKLGWKYTLPKGGMYIWVTIPKLFSHQSSEDFVYTLIDTIGVSGVPGEMFGKENNRYIRFCFGALSLDEIDEFEKRLQAFSSQ